MTSLADAVALSVDWHKLPDWVNYVTITGAHEILFSENPPYPTNLGIRPVDRNFYFFRAKPDELFQANRPPLSFPYEAVLFEFEHDAMPIKIQFETDAVSAVDYLEEKYPGCEKRIVRVTMMGREYAI